MAASLAAEEDGNFAGNAGVPDEEDDNEEEEEEMMLVSICYHIFCNVQPISCIS